jgi:hypothetical protein
MIPNPNDERLILAIKEVAENNIRNLGVNYTEWEYRFGLAINDAKQGKERNGALYSEYEYRYGLAVADVSLFVNPRFNLYTDVEYSFAQIVNNLILSQFTIKTANTASSGQSFDSQVGLVSVPITTALTIDIASTIANINNILTANTISNLPVFIPIASIQQTITTATTSNSFENFNVDTIQLPIAKYRYSPRLGVSTLNGKVTSLTDSINGTNGTNLINDIAGTQPNLLTNILDSQSVVEFGNINVGEYTLLQTPNVLIENTGFYVFVINFKNLGATDVFFDGINVNTYLFYTVGNDAEVFIDGVGYINGTSKAVTSNNWLILSVLIDPNITKIWCNGGTPSSSFSGFKPLVGLTIGARANGFNPIFCHLAELIVFPKNLSISEHNAIGLNLKSIYPSLTWNTPN